MDLQIQVAGVYTRKQRQWILFRYGYFDFQGGNGVYWEEEKGLSATGTPGETSEIYYEGTKIKTYTSSSGRTYIMYKQSQGPWASTSYGSGTIGGIGCPTTAASTALAGLGFSYLPSDFAEIGNSGFTAVVGNRLQNKYTITIHDENERASVDSNNINKIIGCLQEGMPVIVHATASLGSDFTTSQHYFVLLDIDANNKKVYTATGLSYKDDAWYDINYVLKGVNYWYEIQPK